MKIARRENELRNKDVKNEIIEKASCIIYEKGFNHTGLKEILAAANVPKGSFYHYFESKEDLGVQIVEFHKPILMNVIENCMHMDQCKYMDRLKAFFTVFNEKMEKNEMRGGCPLGNLGQELGDLNDTIRIKVEEVFLEITEKFEWFLRKAQENKEISLQFDTKKIAQFLFNSWQGALMRTKVSKDMQPLHIFCEIVFQMLIH